MNYKKEYERLKVKCEGLIDCLSTRDYAIKEYKKELVDIKVRAGSEEIENKMIAYIIANRNYSEEWHKKFKSVVANLALAISKFIKGEIERKRTLTPK